ncbi:MAG: hypothetical protein ABFC18_03345 [Rikenellaceae bacterium]
MQKRKISFIEAVTNTLAGLIVSFCIQLIIYPLLNIPVRLEQNIIITLVFTGASILRGYIVRRIFNKLTYGHTTRHIPQHNQPARAGNDCSCKEGR